MVLMAGDVQIAGKVPAELRAGLEELAKANYSNLSTELRRAVAAHVRDAKPAGAVESLESVATESGFSWSDAVDLADARLVAARPGHYLAEAHGQSWRGSTLRQVVEKIEYWVTTRRAMGLGKPGAEAPVSGPPGGVEPVTVTARVGSTANAKPKAAA